MINMKIAIAGVSGKERSLIAQSLSHLTGYDLIMSIPYSIQSLKYGLSKDMQDCEWGELIIYILSCFSERIEAEQNCKAYISNGSVFNELMVMEAVGNSHPKRKLSTKDRKILSAGIREIIFEYAVKEYDIVLFIEKELTDPMETDTDALLKELIRSSGVKCKSYEYAALSEILTRIMTDLGIKPAVSVKTALENVKQEILF